MVLEFDGDGYLFKNVTILTFIITSHGFISLQLRGVMYVF